MTLSNNNKHIKHFLHLNLVCEILIDLKLLNINQKGFLREILLFMVNKHTFLLIVLKYLN